MENKKQLDKLVNILSKDRDGNGKLSINDILLINKEPMTIFYLTCLLVCIASETDNNSITELFMYIITEKIPEKTGVKLINTENDQENINNVINLINVYLNKSIIIKQIKNTLQSFCCSDFKRNSIIKKNQRFIKNQINFLK